jgi:hypothetical protein
MKMRSLLVFLLMFFSFLLLPFGHLSKTYAQAGGGGAGAGGGDDLIKSSMNDLAMVGGAGLAGAVIGLSTLSFTEHPTENLNNILIGGSIGIILGVAIVAYTQATRGQETMVPQESAGLDRSNKDFSASERLAWHREKFQESEAFFKKEGPKLSFSFPF